ncbi:alpha/beta hydrolase [Microbulbifer litoralis]|uniref:alpha/beta hydrolase n=1 Tax=Microbulbifer litoralis TaxID=2933965 RepID=UPI002027D4AB|nr:alpha/beta hydrolase [Microbulbifer sp. GX H0434]
MHPAKKNTQRSWAIGLALLTPLLLLAGSDLHAAGYTLDSTHEKLKTRYPDIVPVRLEPIEGVRRWPALTYRESNGHSLQLDIFAPEGASAPRPGLLLVHGGGWGSGHRSLLAPLAQALAARGYMTATADYRLSAEAQFPAQVEDLRAALHWLRNHAAEYGLDPDRLAIGGSSAGGQLAALTGLRDGDTSAIVNIDGLWDFTTPLALRYENDPSRAQTSASRFLGGRFEKIPQTWRRASPLNYLDRQSPPLLALSGDNPRFSAGIENVEAQAGALGIPFRHHHYTGAPHSFWLFEPWFGQVVEQLDEFLAATTHRAVTDKTGTSKPTTVTSR